MCWQGYCSWKILCDVKCTFLSKKLSLLLGKLIFSPLFSQLHTFLIWWVFCFGFYFGSGHSNTSSRKEQAPVCKCFESQLSEKHQKKKPVLSPSRHAMHSSAAQHPCSVSFLTFVKCSENDSCTNADLHSFTLFSWPPGLQYGHQRSSFHMRRGWKRAGLVLSKKIIKRAFNFFPSPQPLCFKGTPKTICTESEQKCFYYRDPPPSTWIVARAFWTSAQPQHFGL